MTQENAAKEALHRQEAFARFMLEHQSDGVVACDVEMKLVLFNRTARRWHGIDVQDTPPERWSERYSLYDAEGEHLLSLDAIPLVRAFRHGHIERFDMAIRARNREIRYVSASGAACFDGAGRKLGAVVLMRDITERRRMQNELMRTKAELRQHAASLESCNQALEGLSRLAAAATCAKSEFLANVSHEIRTPMTAILGYTDILLDEEGVDRASGHRRQSLEVIKRNGEHLLGLINGILDLSKIETGQIRIEPTRCAPAQIVADIISSMRVRAEAKGLEFQVDLTPPLPETVFTDLLRVRQILMHLVDNAIKFTNQGAIRLAIRFESENGGPRLRFDVSDTGIGIDPACLERIFQPFMQTDNSSVRRFGGVGLGLSISKHLAAALGGAIAVRSVPGEGSTFSLTIDAGPVIGIPGMRNTQEVLLDRSSETALAISDDLQLHCRILLAEDGSDNRRLISHLLKTRGSAVTVVENGQLAYCEALAAQACGEPFDVILMDMQMPVMDGYTATRQLREQGYTGPIIALTAHAMAEDRQKCLDAGCDDYATKPIDRRRLLCAIAFWTACDSTNDNSLSPALQRAGLRLS